jgi:uncharacterized protein
MKVIFDANVLLSYLLAPDPSQTVAWIVQVCLRAPEIQVLVPIELIRETTETPFTKPYFQGKLSPAYVTRFLVQLTHQGEVPPVLSEEIAAYVRDRDDDYLVAYGLILEADYLVTGDRDLLALRRIEQLAVVTPAAFRRILEASGKE